MRTADSVLALSDHNYTGKLLRVLLADVQLIVLCFPFAELFVALPALAPLKPVTNALSAVMIALSAGYLLLMHKPGLRAEGAGPLLLFLCFLLASVTWADPWMRGDAVSFATRTCFTVMQAFAIVAVSLEKQGYLLRMLKRYALGMTVLSFCFIMLFPDKATWTVDDTPRVQSFFASPNNMGQFLAFAFLTLNFYNRKQFSLPMLLLLNAMLLFQFVKCDSMTSLGGSLLILGVYHFKSLLRPLAIGIILLGLAMPYASLLQKNGTSDLGFMNRDLTFTGRSDVWDIMLGDLDARDRHLTGFGAGGYWPLEHEGFNPTTHMTELDWDPGQAHNGYLDVRVMGGFVGLTLFLIFLYPFLMTVFRKTTSAEGVVCLLVLVILFNNLTESSFFRAKHFYFVLLMVLFWYVQLKPASADLPEAAGAEDSVRQ